MLLNMYTTEFIISLTTFSLAYVAAVTCAGAFRAWVAAQMGDDTAESLGFATLNPVMHVDPMGVAILFISYIFLGVFFGWGRNVPINHFNIDGRYRVLKIIAAYFSDTAMYLLSSLISIIGLLLALGPYMLSMALRMLLCRQLSHSALVASCPTFSSLAITISFIIISFAYLCVLLAALTFIMNSFQIGLFLFTDNATEYREPNIYVLLLAPMVLIFIFSEPIRIGLIKMIDAIAFGMSNLFGLI